MYYKIITSFTTRSTLNIMITYYTTLCDAYLGQTSSNAIFMIFDAMMNHSRITLNPSRHIGAHQINLYQGPPSLLVYCDNEANGGSNPN